ncbi:ELWxxDGT repeat protein [Lacipirellula parvula]|uniref:Uncharacterized protein n=1 Tax=Lacipirellula parvula TaxID=2650471 RepID=A0A5K7XL62_9BACT|nr:ELWxxDGT repeat protein [Lacipirellula parvula]BBO35326.1 hypothetical protein PLANPX_4938 [Lacipirellula parvula]
MATRSQRFSRSPIAKRLGSGQLEIQRLQFETLEPRRVLAVDFDFLGDLNGSPNSGNQSPTNFVEVNSIVYFTKDSTTFGQEVWRTDGTVAGTSLLKDIRPGASDSFPSNLINVAGTLFFTANDGLNGHELWKSDGTAAGTVLVANIRAGAEGSSPASLANIGGTLYFAANDGSNGVELWKSNGTAASTTLVRDINPGSASSAPGFFKALGGVVYFAANDGVAGVELWKSDGTTGGTSLFKDIRAGSASSNVAYLEELSGSLFFRANDGATGYELWKSNGTAAGTTLLVDSWAGLPSSNPTSLTNVSGQLYFAAKNGSSGNELWKSNGTPAGTTQVDDIATGTAGSTPRDFFNGNGVLYFVADEVVNGILTEYFYRSAGTAQTTFPVLQINEVVGSFHQSVNVGSTIYFSDGEDIRRLQSPSSTTTKAVDFTPTNASSSPTSLTDVSGTLFFAAAATGSPTRRLLWKSDGTAGGTSLITSSQTGSVVTPLSKLAAFGGAVLFTANMGGLGAELWRSDGTAAGTYLLKDISPGAASSRPEFYVQSGENLLFVAEDAIWKTDGTAAGTVLVKDPRATGLAYPWYLTDVGGTLFFMANDGATGMELWKSDGTAAGTVLVKDIRAGAAGSIEPTSQFRESGQGMVNVAGTLYFFANDGTSGFELWKSDGSSAGTIRVKDIRTGSASSDPSYLTPVGGKLFFLAFSNSADGLWVSDGTANGTQLLKSFTGEWGSREYTLLTAVGDTLFFALNDGTSGRELWKSDGTPAGTVRVKDIRPGPGSSDLYSLASIGGLLYFRANDGVAGEELWVTDGTEQGTKLLYDFTGDGGGSQPEEMARVGDRLYVVATTESTNSELWVADLTPPLSGDYDGNGRVDGGDFLAWQRGFGGSATPAGSGADGDVNGTVGAGDLAVWKEHFGAGVAQTASVALAVVAPSDAMGSDAIQAAATTALGLRSERVESTLAAIDSLSARGLVALAQAADDQTQDLPSFFKNDEVEVLVRDIHAERAQQRLNAVVLDAAFTNLGNAAHGQRRQRDASGVHPRQGSAELPEWFAGAELAESTVQTPLATDMRRPSAGRKI